MAVLYEKRYNRYQYLPLIFFALLLGGCFFTYGFAFVKTLESFDDLAFFSEEIPLSQMILGGVASLFCLVLAGFWTKGFIQNPVVFRITEEGFESIPNGVSSGFIPWSEVLEVREEVIKGSNAQGVYEDNILAVYFKNPDYYKNKQGEFIKSLMGIEENAGIYQNSERNSQNRGVPLIIPSSLFGKDIVLIRTIFKKHL